jgi:hypothetical protein
MYIFPRAAGFVALWLFVFACSSGASSSTSTGSTGSGGDAVVIDAFCHSIVAPFCKAEYACCSMPQHSFGSTVDECPQVLVSDNQIFCPQGSSRALLEASLRAGTTIFDQAQFDTCLALLKSMSADGLACTEPPEYVFYTTCLGSFQGQIAPGDPCSDDLGYILPCKDGACEQGRCATFLKIGDACQVGIEDTGPPAGALCNYVKKEVCKGARGAGPGLTGTCGPQGEIGDACHLGNDHECKSLNCDVTTGKCALPGKWIGCFNY